MPTTQAHGGMPAADSSSSASSGVCTGGPAVSSASSSVLVSSVLVSSGAVSVAVSVDGSCGSVVSAVALSVGSWPVGSSSVGSVDGASVGSSVSASGGVSTGWPMGTTGISTGSSGASCSGVGSATSSLQPLAGKPARPQIMVFSSVRTSGTAWLTTCSMVASGGTWTHWAPGSGGVCPSGASTARPGSSTSATRLVLSSAGTWPQTVSKSGTSRGGRISSPDETAKRRPWTEPSSGTVVPTPSTAKAHSPSTRW